MGEAELHLIKARLLGGVRAKAGRAEIRLPLPIGFVHGPEGNVIGGPDERVKRSIATVFEAFRRTGSASATIKYFKEHGLQSPSRLRNGAQKREVQWIALVHSKVIRILHNVRYAGVSTAVKSSGFQRFQSSAFSWGATGSTTPIFIRSFIRYESPLRLNTCV